MIRCHPLSSCSTDPVQPRCQPESEPSDTCARVMKLPSNRLIPRTLKQYGGHLKMTFRVLKLYKPQSRRYLMI